MNRKLLYKIFKQIHTLSRKWSPTLVGQLGKPNIWETERTLDGIDNKAYLEMRDQSYFFFFFFFFFFAKFSSGRISLTSLLFIASVQIDVKINKGLLCMDLLVSKSSQNASYYLKRCNYLLVLVVHYSILMQQSYGILNTPSSKVG